MQKHKCGDIYKYLTITSLEIQPSQLAYTGHTGFYI